MKFCYIDESGTGEEPYAVMVGIIADSYRMRPTKNDWKWLLRQLSKILKKQISEIHTSDFYAGNGVWRQLDGTVRARIISAIFDWLKDRNHKIVYCSVDKSQFNAEFNNEPQASNVGTLWCFMALHICLALQKCHQSVSQNKGNTLLVFDNKKSDMDRFINLVIDCPDWSDTYYKRKRGQVQLDQIIDVPYFGDSRHVGLIQLADFVSFFLRRHIELQMGVSPDYGDESRLVEEWARSALALSIPKPAIYLQKGRCNCAKFFYRCTPLCLTS